MITNNDYTILIVDDESINIKILAEIFKDQYKLKIAKNGKKAIEIAEESSPDLILLDIKMPDMNGYKVCEELKSSPTTRNIPVIFITARDNKNDEVKGLNLGAIDYITKPFSSELVKSRVKNYLDHFNIRKETLKLNQAIQQSPEAIIITDINGNIEFVNPRFSELTGYKKNEVINQNPNILKSGYHSDSFYEELWNTISSGEKWKGEIYNQKKNGEYFWEDASISPLINQQNEIINYVAVKQDITEKKKAEEELLSRTEELRETKNMLNKILDLSTEAIRYVDKNFNIIKSNQKYKELNKQYLKDNNIKNQKFLNINDLKCYEAFCTQDCNTEDCSLNKILEGNRIAQKDVEKKINGKKKYFIVTIFPYKNDKGQIEGMIQSYRDITTRKENEMKIANLYQKLESEFEKGRNLHKHFLPNELPEIPDFSYDIHFQPASRLGGDFYNTIKVKDQALFYIADVSGHGLDGSMLNIFIRETINNYLSQNKEIQIDKIIEYIIDRYHKEKFATDYMVCLIIGVLDINNKEFSFINAGIQIPSVKLTNSGEIKPLMNSGLPISTAIDIDSYQDNLKHKIESFTFKPGEKFIISTDGLIEETVIKNNKSEMYGEERYFKLLGNIYNLDPSKMLRKITDDFKSFSGKNYGQDDITCMIIGCDSDA